MLHVNATRSSQVECLPGYAATLTENGHPSGEKLYQLCDIVIDNCGVIGDTSIEIGNLMCGPTSTVVGAAILQAITCGVVERLQEDGVIPEVFISGNVDGGHEKNQVYYQKYRKLIRML